MEAPLFRARHSLHRSPKRLTTLWQLIEPFMRNNMSVLGCYLWGDVRLTEPGTHVVVGAVGRHFEIIEEKSSCMTEGCS